MNKIIVNKNIIDNYHDEFIEINNNTVTFKKDIDVSIEYVDTDKIELTFVIDNCNVNLYEVSFDNEIDVDNKYIINMGNLTVNKFYNNKNCNEKISIDLCSVNSKIDYNFSNICINQEQYIIDINHKCEKSISNINNRSIALKNSDLNFIINSNVPDTSIKSVLNQNTRIVTMGDSNSKISPNMFIDCDDVEAKHGSVIGTFKDDQLFYLMSKGISYSESLKLLIKGYIFSSVKVSSDVRLKILDIIDMYWG